MKHHVVYRTPHVIDYTEEEAAQAVAELEAHEQELEAAYQAARQARYEEQQAAYRVWRQEQYVKREQARVEQEARRLAYWEEFPERAPWQWRKERGIEL